MNAFAASARIRALTLHGLGAAAVLMLAAACTTLDAPLESARTRLGGTVATHGYRRRCAIRKTFPLYASGDTSHRRVLKRLGIRHDAATGNGFLPRGRAGAKEAGGGSGTAATPPFRPAFESPMRKERAQTGVLSMRVPLARAPAPPVASGAPRAPGRLDGRPLPPFTSGDQPTLDDGSDRHDQRDDRKHANHGRSVTAGISPTNKPR